MKINSNFDYFSCLADTEDQDETGGGGGGGDVGDGGGAAKGGAKSRKKQTKVTGQRSRDDLPTKAQDFQVNFYFFSFSFPCFCFKL